MSDLARADYSQLTTVPGAITELSKGLILSKRENVALAREKIDELGAQAQFMRILRARLIAYFEEVRKYLEIYFPKETEKLKAEVMSEHITELIKAFQKINDLIFSLGIIDNNQEILL